MLKDKKKVGIGAGILVAGALILWGISRAKKEELVEKIMPTGEVLKLPVGVTPPGYLETLTPTGEIRLLPEAATPAAGIPLLVQQLFPGAVALAPEQQIAVYQAMGHTITYLTTKDVLAGQVALGTPPLHDLTAEIAALPGYSPYIAFDPMSNPAFKAAHPEGITQRATGIIAGFTAGSITVDAKALRLAEEAIFEEGKALVRQMVKEGWLLRYDIYMGWYLLSVSWEMKNLSPKLRGWVNELVYTIKDAEFRHAAGY